MKVIHLATTEKAGKYLRRLTWPKTFEVDVGMASMPTASFSGRRNSPIRQSNSLAMRIGGATQTPPSTTQSYPMVREEACFLPRDLTGVSNPRTFPHTLSMER